MSDVFAQVKMCERNLRYPLLSVVLFLTVVLVFCLKSESQSQMPLRIALQAPQLDCNRAQLALSKVRAWV